MNLADNLLKTAAAHPDQVAVKLDDVALNYAVLDKATAHVAGLLKEKGVAFQEIDVEKTAGARATMVQRAGGRTSVPQIFVGERHVGGCDDLYALERGGKLDPLLKDAADA